MARRDFVEQMARGEWDEALAWHDEQHQSLADVDERPVEWLWENYIPRGMLTLVTGQEGLGKSQLTLKLAAAFSQGRYGDRHPSTGAKGGLVKLYTAEDPLREVLKPRLVANDAVVRNIYVEGMPGTTWLPEGIDDIAEGVKVFGFNLVVIDPVIAYFGSKHDSNKAQDVREIMRRLATLAEASGAVVIGVMHPKKGEETSALHKLIGGSAAFGQAARSVLGVAKHPDHDDQRVVGRIKGNLSVFPTPVIYKIASHEYPHDGQTIKTSKVQFVGHMDLDNIEFERLILEVRTGPSEAALEREDKKADAMNFLTGYLPTARSAPRQVLVRVAAERGITRSTLDNAARALEKAGQLRRMGAEWEWVE